jgi:recombination protein RecA
MPVDPSNLDVAWEAIEKAYGDGALRRASQMPNIKRIPTGSYELDYITGGGVPLGRWTWVYGGYMSAKTLFCWNVIREAQKMGLVCAYYNAEKQFDRDFCTGLGVDVDKLIVVEGSVIEDLAKKMEMLISSAHVHVIDSLSMCIPLAEMEAEVEDKQMATSAKAWTRSIRRLSEVFDDTDNAVIMVDQVRAPFGANMARANDQPSQIKMIQHVSSLNMRFKRGGWLFRKPDGLLTNDSVKNVTLSGAAEADGIEVDVIVEKSRVSKVFRRAKLRLDFEDYRFDTLYELAKAAKFYKIVKAGGSWYTLPDGKKVQGEAGLMAALRSDEQLAAQVAAAMKEAM